MSDENKNIEEFFKRFSETYPSKITFNEAHWQRMEAQLDQEMPVGGPGADGGALGHLPTAMNVITWIILALGLWFNFDIQQRRTAEASSVDREVQAGMVSGELENAMNTVGEEPASTRDKVAIVAPQQSERPDDRLPGNRQATLVSEEETTNRAVGEAGRESVSSAEPSVGEGSAAGIPAAASSKNQPSVRVETSATETTGDPALEEVVGDEHTERLTLISLKGISPAFDWQVEPGDRIILPVAMAEDLPVKAQSYFPRVAVGFSISPDLSSNQLGAYNRMGAEIGFVGEYRFTRRWSVELGVLSTSKRYNVNGHEYSAEEGFWDKATNGEIPETVDAVCHVLDIPINVRYRFMDNAASSFSASVGLSSYLMLSEDYEYELSYGGGGWGTGHENDHFFSVANVQVYYERKLGRNFAIEAAPFLKLPLSGYGHGDIKFHSLGMFINVKRYFMWR